MAELSANSIFLPEPTKLYLGKEARMKLHKMGAKSVAVILFNEVWGPMLRYYYVKRSKLITKLLENRAFSVELSIVGKYVKEMILKDGTRVLIAPFMTKGEFGEKMNFILIELRENIRNRKRLLEMLESVVSELNGSREIDLERVSAAIRKRLIGKDAAK